MRGVEGKEGKRRFGFSYISLVVAIVTYLGTWGYSVFAADWRAKADVPQIDPILKIIKGLRQYQQVNATFPQTFNQVEAQVWKHPNPPSYGSDGRTLVIKNYYYLYVDQSHALHPLGNSVRRSCQRSQQLLLNFDTC